MSYLFCRMQVAVVGKTYSDQEPVSCCVSQGTILGPFFIDSSNSKVTKYAHDTVTDFANEDIVIEFWDGERMTLMPEWYTFVEFKEG